MKFKIKRLDVDDTVVFIRDEDGLRAAQFELTEGDEERLASVLTSLGWESMDTPSTSPEEWGSLMSEIVTSEAAREMIEELESLPEGEPC